MWLAVRFFLKIAFEQSREEINAKIVIWAKPSIFFNFIFSFFWILRAHELKMRDSLESSSKTFFSGTFE